MQVRALVKLSYKVVKGIPAYSPLLSLGMTLGINSLQGGRKRTEGGRPRIVVIVGLRVARYFETDPNNLGRWPHGLLK